MKWYKLNIINKAVFTIAFAILVFILFGSKGPWDLYVYLLLYAILLGILIIDLIVQALNDDKRKKQK